jgi:hypothetical protein
MLVRGNNKGFALVITMLFAMIALALTGALLYMVTQSTLMTGIGQRYATALDASKGSMEITFVFIRDYPDTMTPAAGTLPNAPCAYEKIQHETSKWVSSTLCTAIDSDDSVDAVKTNSDVIIVLGLYTTWSKIVNTRITKTASGTDCESGCTYYTIESYTENTSRPMENAHVTSVYMTAE